MKILIVEDDSTSRLILNKMLEEYGECIVARDGLEGLDKYKKNMEKGLNFDLICLDIMMPRLNGNEVLEKIRKFEKGKEIKWEERVRIVMTTALTGYGDVKESFRNLCDGYIMKPYRKDKIKLELKKLNLI